MPEIMGQSIERMVVEEKEKKLDISPEKIRDLTDHQEAPTFYRGLPAEDALKAIFGRLELDSKPEGSSIGERDNTAFSSRDAIYYAPTSFGKNGKKFLCAIGFDPAEEVEILPSCMGKLDQLRINGRVRATEVMVRPAGKKPGQSGKVKFLSPKEFYYWYEKNIGLEK